MTQDSNDMDDCNFIAMNPFKTHQSSGKLKSSPTVSAPTSVIDLDESNESNQEKNPIVNASKSNNNCKVAYTEAIRAAFMSINPKYRLDSMIILCTLLRDFSCRTK